MYQKVIIVGNLGRDPEMRYMNDGTAATNFSVAVNTGWGENKSTLWVRVTAWGKLAETCNQYLRKGRRALVEGELTPDKETGGPRIWWTSEGGTARASFEIRANSVKFLSGRDDAEPQQQAAAVETEDIPF